jgi:hypothetical protein
MLSVIFFTLIPIITYFRGVLIKNDKTVKQLFFVFAIIFLSVGCKGPLSAPGTAEAKPGVHKVVVNEVIHAGGYTYLNVSEKRKKIWLAVPGMQATKGDKISYSGGLEMINFFSKELKRTFASVLFLESVNIEAVAGENAGMKNKVRMGEVKTEKINISIAPTEGCISLAKLLETKADYSGKTVRVMGKITKYNPDILGKNWIHIQDGSEFNGDFDLTITTDSQLAVGDTVTFEGKITLKKDFGYGYFYDVIMENGKLIK